MSQVYRAHESKGRFGKDRGYILSIDINKVSELMKYQTIKSAKSGSETFLIM